MTYRLAFLASAEKAWRKLGATIREQLKKKLIERLEHPRVPKDALSGFTDHYKIKLRDAGYRLVYRVDDLTVTVLVVAIGKRERSEAYRKVRRELIMSEVRAARLLRVDGQLILEIPEDWEFPDGDVEIAGMATVS